jgi:two-component system response regulator (stage 0 sporulation protein F)
MPRCEGIDVLAYTRMQPLPAIVVTAFGTPESFAEARELGAVECFSKPFDIDDLCAAVLRHLPASDADRP